MKVKFIQDKEYDRLMIWQMLKTSNRQAVIRRAKRMKLSEKEFKKISDAGDFEEVKEFLTLLLENRYRKYHQKITNALKSYQKSWEEINDYFSGKIEEITGQKWKFDEYLVVLSPFHPGVSNRKNNKVIRWIFEDPQEQRRITAHEILMIHLWDVFDKQLSVSGYYHLWALNEITTVAILGLEPELDKLWSENLRGFDQFLGNYPQLTQLKEDLKRIYLDKINFQDYLGKAVVLLKEKYSQTSFSF